MKKGIGNVYKTPEELKDAVNKASDYIEHNINDLWELLCAITQKISISPSDLIEQIHEEKELAKELDTLKDLIELQESHIESRLKDKVESICRRVYMTVMSDKISNVKFLTKDELPKAMTLDNVESKVEIKFKQNDNSEDVNAELRFYGETSDKVVTKCYFNDCLKNKTKFIDGLETIFNNIEDFKDTYEKIENSIEERLPDGYYSDKIEKSVVTTDDDKKNNDHIDSLADPIENEFY